jgi:hypothetical protein
MILVPVSIGEALDKLSILMIKSDRIEDPDKLANVRREIEALTEVLVEYRLPDLEARLHSVNSDLWDVEDAIRQKEREQRFDDEFVAMARSVYRLNDLRSRIKRQINDVLGSELIEEKSY